MSKTPYEIRFDTLMLARDLLVSQYEAQKERIYFLVEDKDKQDASKELVYPTLHDIKVTAGELRKFVDDTNAVRHNLPNV
jgi:hypothetical protein